MASNASLRPALALLALLPSLAVAQAPEYELTLLGPAPAAYITAGRGMNDLGEVVGFAQFSNSDPAIRAWHWTAAQGMVLLPAPAGIFLGRAAAQDINNSGVIAGDGGGDAGEAWRYSNGSFELLGSLPGYGTSTAEGINEAGVITGTAKSSQLTNPKQAFVAIPGQPLVSIASEAYANSINDAGQVVGEGAPILPGGGPGGYRYTPGMGILSFGPVAGRHSIHANSVNASGDTVGSATGATGVLEIPFIYTDLGGMQEIGDFESHSGARWINDAGEVIGWREQSGTDGWIWTAQDGLRFLDTLYDGWQSYTLTNVHRINNAGQILITVYNQTTFEFEPALLTPLEPCGSLHYCQSAPNSAGPGAVMSSSGSTSIAQNDLVLEVLQAAPGQFGIFYYGADQVQLPFGDGFRCVGGGQTFRLPPSAIDASGFASHAIDYQSPPSPAGEITAHSTWNFQFWYRDPAAGGAGFNLSDGLSLSFCD